MNQAKKTTCYPPCNSGNKPGFTVIELMIVVVIIGILLAVAAPGFKNATKSGNEPTYKTTKTTPPPPKKTQTKPVKILQPTSSKTRISQNNIPPKLYILAIGATDYPYLPQRDQLDYPAQDAKEFTAAFASMEGSLFSEVHTRILTKNGDMMPTAANIEDNLNFLAKAGQYDMAILFMAGHGIRGPKGKYYFVPEDVKKDNHGDFRRSTLIRWSDIKDALDSPATMLAFFDTCHSASFFQDGNMRAVDNDAIIQELTKQGTIVFASSTGSESSIEDKKWQHGAFTYAILKGLRQERADLIKDGKSIITIKELDAFISSEVPRMTNGRQHPVSYAPEGYKDFAIWRY